MFVSPPLTITAVLLALIWELFWNVESEFASPLDFESDADTPQPLVPYDTPKLPLFDSFSLRVDSVSWLLSTLT
ncbi:hypothetical protein PCO31111_01445 [Pandoraea communis]|uniref:Uncharacterized protein n=1 Tax=Pandoraea communis TaxID=2508297 RepID=A0A5E4TJB0_9BURK|nr:hypothetical protein PCO31111_01445 [Pandoraea communis]